MWNKSAFLLIVRVETLKRRNLKFPVPIWVVDEFFEALTDLARLGEMVLRLIPVPVKDAERPHHLHWIKTFSPSGAVSGVHGMIKELRKYKGLEVVDVDTGDVKVKVSLK